MKRSHDTEPAQSPEIEHLERLRVRVLERLDWLETLARQRSASGPVATDSTIRNRALEERLAELEEAEQRLRAEAERQAQEWTASLTQLEADRRLLADAWERVEQDRIAFASAADVHSHSDGQGLVAHHGVPTTRPHAPVFSDRSTAAGSAPNDPVTHAVLQQFQTLCSDVRRNAEKQCNSR